VVDQAREAVEEAIASPARMTQSWSQATVQDYHRLTLRAHSLLRDVPIHDVWRVALPGGGPSRTMKDVRTVLDAARQSQRLSLPVRALFGLRSSLGRFFRWDRPQAEPAAAWSYLARLGEEDRRRSIVPPGTLDGPFTLLYVHPMEAVSEIRNATVHAFLVWALEPTTDGYQLFWAIYVLPVSALTRPYMALIDPFRRWLVYPAVLQRIHDSWARAFPSAT
jgi:hypothetical protein